MPGAGVEIDLTLWIGWLTLGVQGYDLVMVGVTVNNVAGGPVQEGGLAQGVIVPA